MATGHHSASGSMFKRNYWPMNSSVDHKIILKSENDNGGYDGEVEKWYQNQSVVEPTDEDIASWHEDQQTMYLNRSASLAANGRYSYVIKYITDTSIYGEPFYIVPNKVYERQTGMVQTDVFQRMHPDKWICRFCDCSTWDTDTKDLRGPAAHMNCYINHLHSLPDVPNDYIDEKIVKGRCGSRCPECGLTRPRGIVRNQILGTTWFAGDKDQLSGSLYLNDGSGSAGHNAIHIFDQSGSGGKPLDSTNDTNWGE
jgi:hypothetical protein